MVGKRLASISSNKDIFDEEKKDYEEALRESGYKEKLSYEKGKNKLSEKEKNMDKKKKKNRKRKEIYFNPPWNDNLKTNIGGQFLKIVDKHFGSKRKDNLNKIFNRKILKVSYSNTTNFGNIIKNKNKKLLQEANENERERKKERKKCDCRDGEECPLKGECVIESVVYKANVIKENGEKIAYIGSTEGRFKQRYYGHKSDIKNEKGKNKTTLAKHVWEMKDKKENVKIEWEILKKCNKYKSGSKRCDVCLSEKLEILKGKRAGERMLNKRSELMNKCRHRRKFILEPG